MPIFLISRRTMGLEGRLRYYRALDSLSLRATGICASQFTFSLAHLTHIRTSLSSIYSQQLLCWPWNCPPFTRRSITPGSGYAFGFSCCTVLARPRRGKCSLACCNRHYYYLIFDLTWGWWALCCPKHLQFCGFEVVGNREAMVISNNGFYFISAMELYGV